MVGAHCHGNACWYPTRCPVQFNNGATQDIVMTGIRAYVWGVRSWASLQSSSCEGGCRTRDTIRHKITSRAPTR